MARNSVAALDGTLLKSIFRLSVMEVVVAPDPASGSRHDFPFSRPGKTLLYCMFMNTKATISTQHKLTVLTESIKIKSNIS